ncbi:hypothetical protein KAR91_62270 [Candidatus Pacearchaeota archaeon]|nr:hypothetical protein [Candidatus Pacearchaeota archaeon]
MTHEKLIVMRNVRRLIRGRVKQPDNWVLYMEIFGTGSTTAHRQCEKLGLNPDSKSSHSPD